MFQNLIRATQQQQQIKLARRRQALAEQQFASQEIDTKAKRQAVSSLANVKWNELHKVSPKTLATINEGSLGTLLQISAKASQGQPIDKDAPREVKLLAAMREQVGPEGDIMESDIWKVMTTGKSKEKNEQDVRQTLRTNASRNPIFMTWSKEKQDQFIENQVSSIFQEPAARTKELSLMERSLQEFQKAKRSEAINSLMGGRISQ